MIVKELISSILPPAALFPSLYKPYMFGSSPLTSCHQTEATFFYRSHLPSPSRLKDPVPRFAPLRNGARYLRQLDLGRTNAFLRLDGLPIAKTDKKYSRVWQSFNQRQRRTLVKEQAGKVESRSPSPLRRRTYSLMSSRLSEH